MTERDRQSTRDIATVADNLVQSPKLFTSTTLSPVARTLGHWYIGVYLRIYDPGPSTEQSHHPPRLFSPGDYR